MRITTVAPGITTAPSHAGTNLYVGGRRVGTYKSDRALAAAIERHRAEGEAIAARYAEAAAAACPVCGMRADAHPVPHGNGFMPPEDWHERNGAHAPR